MDGALGQVTPQQFSNYVQQQQAAETLLYQLDIEDIVKSFQDLLKGRICDDKGNVLLKRKKPFLNDDEIVDVILILKSCIDRSVTLSNFDQRDISITVGPVMRSLVKYFRTKTDIPRDIRDMIFEVMFLKIYAGVTRAKGGLERKTARESSSSQSTTIRSEQIGGKGSMFSRPPKV